MEFWGVEVKPGQTVKCDPGDDRYLHVSQASLGETKKDKLSENVPVFVKLDDQKLVLGTLSGDKFPQVSYDLVFEREFELSHGSKSTSVFFCGYKTLTESEENPEFGSDDDDDDVFEDIKNDLILEQKTNGKPKLEKAISGKGEGSAAKAEGSGKSKIKAGEPKSGKPKPEEEDDDDDDVSEEDDTDSDDDEEMADLGDDSDEDDSESSDEEDEATPKKAEISKKRAADSATKTPVPEKKTKLVSPTGSQKTGGDGKKGHTATPHPAKQAGKTPANKSPKSGGSVSCKSCSKTFNSDNALQAHTKAKHA